MTQMKDSDNDFTFTPANQSPPPYTQQQTNAPENRLFKKTVNWQGPALVILTCVVIGITFSQWQQLITNLFIGNHQGSQYLLLYAFIGLELTLALFVITAILIKDNALVFAISVIYSAVPFAILPRREFTVYFIIASAILAASSAFSIRADSELLIKPSIRRYFKAGASRHLASAFITVALCAGMTFTASFTTIEKLLPAKVFNFYMEQMYEYLPTGFFLPAGISNSNKSVAITLPRTNENIDDYLERLANQTMNKAMAEAIAEADASAAQSMVITAAEIDATVALMRSDLSQQTGMTLTGKEQAITVLYKLFVNKADGLISTYSDQMPIIIGVAVYALLRSLSLLAYYPALILTYILMYAGLALNLWRLNKETVTLERFRL